ncbi:TonB-dependent receptor [candidate division KSB1 bacterium]|nr:TonB-dependent receptor [candidate division KSB1 bacterium]
MRILKKFFLIAFVIYGISFGYLTFLIAGTTGKIAGTVKDKDTGEPLIGANIQIEGTYLGSAADIKGNYHIISVPPGKYMLQVTMMGYQILKIQNVAVSVDQTTRIDIAMVQEVLKSTKSVEIIAERPIIQKDLTTSIEVVTMERFEQSTATSVAEAVNLQTGVFFDPIPVEGNLSGLGRGEARYSIRGGDQDEVVWYVDGTRTAAMIEATADGGGSLTIMNRESVQEIQVITGGFNAEYGQAQSGIVNIITKEGDQKYTYSLDYLYGPPHQRHFGTYLYDQNKNYEFLAHTLPDGTLDPLWWTPDRARQVYDYRKIPDHTLRFSFGGPVPGRFLPIFGSQIRKMTFFLAGQYEEQAYPVPRPRDSRKITNLNLSGNCTILPGLNLKFGGLYNKDAHSTNREESFPYNAKYYRGYGSLLDNYTYQARLSLIHTISSSLYYELKLSSYTFKTNETPSPYRVLGESKNPDVWGWHYYDDFEDEHFISHLFSPLTHNILKDLSFTGNVNWQANQTNFIKAGFEFHGYSFQEDTWSLPAFSDNLSDWRIRGLNETYHPWQVGVYLQDKLEFESMILNVGIRYDLFHGNRKWFTKESFVWNPALDPAYDPKQDPDRDGIDAMGHKKWDFQNVLQKPREWVEPQQSLNPRLGISFPISDQTVFHFSYGHFYQIPPINSQFEFVYFRPVSIIKGATATDSDPERVINMTLEPLKPERTIQFEMGIKKHFENIAVLNITAFYKDIFDHVERAEFLDRSIYGINPYTGAESQLAYSSRFSGDYGDSRGVEVTLKTFFSQNLIVDLNYSFSKSKQGKATPQQIHIDAKGNVNYRWYSDVTDRLPLENSFSRPHILRINCFMQFPSNWYVPFVTPVLKNTDASLLFRYVSGQAFTYLEPTDPADLLDNHRFPAIQTWDLKVNKYFHLKEHTFTFYTKITNLFNRKTIKSWGLPVPFGNAQLEKYIQTGDPTWLTPYNISYSIYHEPRNYWFGLRYHFK